MIIEEKIRNYFNAKATQGIIPETYVSIPEVKKPSTSYEFIVLEKTGSSVDNHIITSTIAFQSFADTLYKAAVVNEKVKEVMQMCVDDDVVIQARLNSDYNFTDQSTKQPRYQAVFDVIHYVK